MTRRRRSDRTPEDRATSAPGPIVRAYAARRAMASIPGRRRRQLLRGTVLPRSEEAAVAAAYGRYLMGPLALVEWALVGLVGAVGGMVVFRLLGEGWSPVGMTPVTWVVLFTSVWTVAGGLLRREQGRRLVERMESGRRGPGR